MSAYLAFLVFSLVFASCKSKTTFSIVSYNAQTFFDLVEDGREFKEFRSSKWKEADYDNRLKRLLDAVKLCTNQLQEREDLPDVLVLQEIESEQVLKDFCKRLNHREAYKELVFVPPEDGGAFSTAILSKYKILGAKAHKVHMEGMLLRPIIEAEICFELNGKERNLKLFAVHWKSKREGCEDVRKMQEELLYNRMKECKKKGDFVLACGDFNQNDFEFSKLQEFQNAWQLYDANTFSAQHAIDDVDLKAQGSYCYRDEWERLDHFFYMERSEGERSFEVSKFVLFNSAPLVRNGKINRYNASTKRGYSDHLPIGLLLRVCK